MDDKEIVIRVLKKWGKVQGNLASDACCEMIAANILYKLEREQDLGLNAYTKNKKQRSVRGDCHL